MPRELAPDLAPNKNQSTSATSPADDPDTSDHENLSSLPTMAPPSDLAALPTMAPPPADEAPADAIHLLSQTTVPPCETGDDPAVDEPIAQPIATATANAGKKRARKQPAPSIFDALPGPGDVVGHYELIRELGRGGMGVVFLARDIKLARRVAIKFILTDSASLTARFVAEARTTALCQHDNIVIIHEIDEYAGSPYMVLEYLRGQSLRDHTGGKAMAPRRAVELMLPVVRALERAHQHNIVHRDLKPENIHVTEAGAIKVLDFGIAKAFADGPDASITATDADADADADASGNHAPPTQEDEPADGQDRGDSASGGPPSGQIPLPGLRTEYRTKAGALLGTVPYMSPEQLAGNIDIDARTDIWAVGMMLYELVLGHHPLAPFSIKDMESVADLDEPMPSASKRVPHVGKLGAVIERCLIKDKYHRIATASELLTDLEALSRRGDTEAGALLGDDADPFAGLAAFQTSDSDRFFGRDREIASLVTQLHSHPLITVVGPSGSGKSSLVRAGVIPALETAGEGWKALIIRPGRDPLAALSAVLEQVRAHRFTSTVAAITSAGTTAAGATGNRATGKGATADTASGVLGTGTTGDWAQDSGVPSLQQAPGYVGQQLREWARRRRRRIVLYVDQFEELYTLVSDAAVRKAFLQCLEGAADDASSPLRVVLSIRSDFLDRIAEDGRFMSEVSRGLFFLSPMDRDSLGQALSRPVEAADYRFEDRALLDEMLDALQGTAGALPLLQFAATKLWDGRDRQRRVLTRTCYQAFGGVAGALATHGDAVLAGISAARVGVARSIFERLVTPERTRAVVTLDELRQLPGDPDTIEEVVHHLADSRLIAIEHHTQGQSGTRAGSNAPALNRSGATAPISSGQSTVEIIHESLITSWPTLRGWLDDSQDDAEFLARVRSAAQQWYLSNRRDGLLWRDEPAQEAKEWYRGYRGQLGMHEQQFIDAVLAQLERGQRRKRAAVAGIIALLSVLLVIAGIGLVRIQAAEKEARDRAETEAAAKVEAEQAKERAEQAKEQAERAQAQAELDRKKAEAAEQRALEEAENTRKALEEAKNAREQQAHAASQARQAATQARAAESRAQRDRTAAEAAEQEARAQAERAQEAARRNQQLIDRAVGPLNEEI